jgi:hypothetical protein
MNSGHLASIGYGFSHWYNWHQDHQQGGMYLVRGLKCYRAIADNFGNLVEVTA